MGIRQAVECTADCGNFRHRHCLKIANKEVSNCLACTVVTQLASSSDKSYIDTLLKCAGLDKEEDSDHASVTSEGKVISRPQSNEASDVEGDETVVYKVQGDEVWQSKAGILTKVGDINIIKKVMDQAAVKGLLDAFMGQLKADRAAEKDVERVEREAEKEAEKAEREAEKAEREAEKGERTSEVLKQREERIRDKHELRDYVKNFVGQFVDTGDHATQRNTNPPVSASIPNQSQGALGMGPCHSRAVSNGDQTSKRGRSKDRGASQDSRRCH
ncbi:MAG: hypothetical protein GY820_00490, partial [Gammaproteobacteria bacterium]|nr:hypothetical protein [Gammaproteobacteria bacterium]